MMQTKEAKEKTMRAVALDRFGGPETLQIQTVPGGRKSERTQGRRPSVCR